MAKAQVVEPELILRDIAEAVRKSPGLSRADLRRLVRARGSRVLTAIDTAIEAGLVHEGVGFRPARGGARRSAVVLYPGPTAAVRTVPTVNGEWLRAERERIGVSQAELARRLGIDRPLVVHWEAGRQRVSAALASRVHEALSRGPGPKLPTMDELVDLALPQLLRTIRRSPGLHLTGLRLRAGRGRSSQLALERALVSGLVHRLDVRQGQSCRSVAGYFPGSAPTVPLAPASEDLRDARRVARWTQAQMAEACGVSVPTYSSWERGLHRLPTWALARSAEVIDEARAADPIPGLTKEVAALVARKPGITHAEISDQLKARPVLVRQAIAVARRAGDLHSSPGQGFYPGPEPKPFRKGELRRRRIQLGWSAQELAAELGVAPSHLSGWENGRHKISAPRVAQIRALFDSGAPTPIDATKALLLEAITAQPGQPFEYLTRRRFGRDQRTSRALEMLEQEGKVHRRWTLNQASRGARSWFGYHPGRQPEATSLAPAQLKRRREAAGLTRAQLAEMVGVTGTTLGQWENGKQPLREPWTSMLVQILDAAGTAPTPHRDIKPKTDTELEADALAVIRAQPGLTASQVAGQMQGSMQRRLGAVRRMVAAGRIEERPGTSARKRPTLYLND